MSDENATDAVAKKLADLKAAGETARQVGSQAKQAGTDAIGQAQDVAHEAMARGSSLAGAVNEQASSAVNAQKQSLAERLDDVAKAVHRSGEQLEGHQDWVAGLVERGADELSAFAETMRTNDLQALLSNLEGLARRQPALFVGASLAAGFALSRVGRVAVSGASQADLPHMPEVTSERT